MHSGLETEIHHDVGQVLPHHQHCDVILHAEGSGKCTCIKLQCFIMIVEGIKILVKDIKISPQILVFFG